MKITAALVALAAAVAAPLASALDFPPTSTCSAGSDAANFQLLSKIDISNSIKRTTVNGGARIVQTIKLTNNNAGTAEVILFTVYDKDNTVSKGSARAPGGSKATLSGSDAVFSNKAVVTTPVSSGVPSKLSIPSGKTLKATIAYKSKQCPGTGSATSKDYAFGPAVIATSFSCWKAASSNPTVKVNDAKRC